MKAQNREEKAAKAQEREKLQREIAARERAEKIQVRASFDTLLISAALGLSSAYKLLRVLLQWPRISRCSDSYVFAPPPPPRVQKPNEQ